MSNGIKSLKRKALFLDRDGVLNTDEGYTYEFSAKQIIPGSTQLIKYANEKGYKVIVITNQSGIGRGYYTEKEFHKYMQQLIEYYKFNGAYIDDYFFAPFYAKSSFYKYRLGKNFRKPNTGMIDDANEKYRLDLSESIFVGDKYSDMEAGKRAKIYKLVLYDELCKKIQGNDDLFKVKCLSMVKDLPIW